MAPAACPGHTGLVGSALRTERVRRDVEVLARGGLDIATFLAEVDESLHRAVPSCASCVATVDPETNLLTGTFKFGDLADRHERDHEWGLVEYGQVEPTSFAELAHADVPGAGVHLATGGDVRRSPRLRDFIGPYFGYADELRVVARVDQRVWGVRRSSGLPVNRSAPRRSRSSHPSRRYLPAAYGQGSSPDSRLCSCPRMSLGRP